MTAYSVCVALAALPAILLAAVLWRREKPGVPLASALLSAALGAILGARLLYCLFRLDFYLEFGLQHVLFLREGGYLFYGALLGGILGVTALCRARGQQASTCLDVLIAPALLMLALCRLAERFTGEGLGNWVDTGLLARAPFAFVNDYGEMQLAIFRLEALCALAMVLLLLRRRCAGRFVLGLCLYAACQVVLESLRMDSSLKIGFVRISQVLSGVTLLLLTLWQNRGSRRAQALGALAIALLCAGVGGLEWALEKTMISNILIYLCMTVLALAMGLLASGKRCFVNEPARAGEK